MVELLSFWGWTWRALVVLAILFVGSAVVAGVIDGIRGKK